MLLSARLKPDPATSPAALLSPEAHIDTAPQTFATRPTEAPCDPESPLVSPRHGHATLAQDLCLYPENVRHIDLAVRALLHNGNLRHGL